MPRLCRRMLFPFADHCLKLLMVVRMISTHDAVPDIEVQAEIARHIFVVHGMVRSGIAPERVYTPREPAPKKLIARMPAYIQHELIHAPRQYRQRV